MQNSVAFACIEQEQIILSLASWQTEREYKNQQEKQQKSFCKILISVLLVSTFLKSMKLTSTDFFPDNDACCLRIYFTKLKHCTVVSYTPGILSDKQTTDRNKQKPLSIISAKACAQQRGMGNLIRGGLLLCPAVRAYLRSLRASFAKGKRHLRTVSGLNENLSNNKLIHFKK